MVLTQSLPPTVSSYTAAQRAEIVAATKAVKRQWRRVGTDFDAGWRLIAPTLIGIMDEAQRSIAAGAADYIPAVLEETGQLDRQLADPDPSGLVGFTGAGTPTGDAMAAATIRAKQSVADGATTFLALQDAGQYLSYVAGTILSDTGRGAEGLSMSAFGSTGWVRVLSPPSCARCAILAGRHYRYNSGFQRHPGCDCRHMPATEMMASDLTVDPVAYYQSLDEPGRLKFAGSQANLAAIESGADINQVVNAYRRSAGMSFAQVPTIKSEKGLKFTTEGATKRSIATRAQQSLRRNGPVQARMMPESIYMRAKDPEDAIRLLKLYGWINDSGSTSLIRGARAAAGARPAGVLATRGRSAAGGGGGRPPTPLRSGSMDDPDGIAKKILADAVAAEPDATRLVAAAADFAKGEVVREDTRFKSETSILEKLERFKRGGSDPYGSVVGRFNDALRYTVLLDDARYWNATTNAVDLLGGRGFTVITRPRGWRTTGYRGYNVTVQGPEGRQFEVQFHTPESLAASEATHDWYEEQRKLKRGTQRWLELERLISDRYDEVPRPPGVPEVS